LANLRAISVLPTPVGPIINNIFRRYFIGQIIRHVLPSPSVAQRNCYRPFLHQPDRLCADLTFPLSRGVLTPLFRHTLLFPLIFTIFSFFLFPYQHLFFPVVTWSFCINTNFRCYFHGLFSNFLLMTDYCDAPAREPQPAQKVRRSRWP